MPMLRSVDNTDSNADWLGVERATKTAHSERNAPKMLAGSSPFGKF